MADTTLNLVPFNDLLDLFGDGNKFSFSLCSDPIFLTILYLISFRKSIVTWVGCPVCSERSVPHFLLTVLGESVMIFSDRI